MNSITFSPSDYSYPNLEPLADDIANFLYKHKSKIADFCELMRISGNWDKSNYKNQLLRWESSKVGRRRKNAAADTLQLIDYCHSFFDICTNKQEIDKMRGLVPEKLVEKIFSLRYKDKSYEDMGFGVVVNINNQPIEYHCRSPYSNQEDSDGYRQSVDAGVWDGSIGEFAEVKFRPQAFHTKDIKYLQLLASSLSSKGINYQIFLICFDDKNLTEEKLKTLNLWSAGEFILIGREEVFDLQAKQ